MPKFVLLKAFKLTGVVNSNILYFYRSLIFDKRARQFPVEGLAVLGFCSIELTVRTFVSILWNSKKDGGRMPNF